MTPVVSSDGMGIPSSGATHPVGGALRTRSESALKIIRDTAVDAGGRLLFSLASG